MLAGRHCPYCDEPELWEAVGDDNDTHFYCRCFTCESTWDWEVGQAWPQHEHVSLTALYPNTHKSFLAHLSPIKAKHDHDLVTAIKAFMPPTNPTLPGYDALLAWSSGKVSERDLGFGDKVVRFGKYNPGYASCVISAIMVEDQLAEVKLLCTSVHKPDGYPLLSSLWGNGVRKAAYGYTYRLANPDLMAQRQAVYTQQLGEPPAAPQYWQGIYDYYEILSEPHHNYALGSACGYAGTRPEGHTAVKRLFAEFKFDLIRSAMRGSNPEGRVYAALILLEAERLGFPLTDDDHAMIERLKQLPIRVHTCSGCTDFNDVTTAEAITNLRGWLMF